MFSRQSTFGPRRPSAARPAIAFLQARFRRLSTAGALVVTLALALAGPAAPAPDLHTLEIVSRSGVHVFSVELAVNDADRAQGLMFRRELPEGKGMLFDFSPDELKDQETMRRRVRDLWGTHLDEALDRKLKVLETLAAEAGGASSSS